MQFDYFIIGQGICGTFLSYYLKLADKKVLVIDQAQSYSSTKVASGVINPVTGRRVVTTWMIEALLPFAWNAYQEIGVHIGKTIIETKNTVSFAPSFQMKETYEKRMAEPDTYIKDITDSTIYKQYFDYIFNCFGIEPTYLIHLHPLLEGWRNKLRQSNDLLEELFDESALTVNDDHVLYKNISAQKIIYCNGINTFENKYWKNLPYVFNKGQALIVDIPGLPANNIYKYGALSLVPWYNGLWWAGSSYENEFDTTAPTEAFRNSTINNLNNICKLSFTVIDHLASLRPATLERRPFVGLHPQHPSLGIFNGMGTKGCSLAPYFAKQLCDHLVLNKVIDPLADVKRFRRIISEV